MTFTCRGCDVHSRARDLFGRVRPSAEHAAGRNASYTESQDITLPPGIGGQFYIYVIADAAQVELDQGANAGARDGTIRLRSTKASMGRIISVRRQFPVTYREPDLRVTNLVAPITPATSGRRSRSRSR